VFPVARRIALALALLAVIGLASTSRVESGNALAPSWVGFSMLAVTGAIAVAIALSGLFTGVYTSLAETRRSTKFLAGLIAALIVTAFVAVALAHNDWWVQYYPAKRGLGADGAGGRVPEIRADLNHHSSLPIVLVAVGGALVAALVATALLVAARRRRGLPGPAADDGDPILEAVEESLDDLRRERDVRCAIIACYARMERALQRSGSPRRLSEAPFEYLARILQRVPGGGLAANVLTELFERAKFSVEPLGEREKQRAIAALEELRMEVTT
jgi:hypothetical protein